MVKTRTLATSLIKRGKVRLNNEHFNAPSRMVGVEDVMTITLPRKIKILRVKATGIRRGPASEAKLLYEDLSPTPAKRDILSRPAKQAVREEGAGRPTKKERRELTRFRVKAGEDFS